MRNAFLFSGFLFFLGSVVQKTTKLLSWDKKNEEILNVRILSSVSANRFIFVRDSAPLAVFLKVMRRCVGLLNGEDGKGKEYGVDMTWEMPWRHITQGITEGDKYGIW